jgi:hypothetical protein
MLTYFFRQFANICCVQAGLWVLSLRKGQKTPAQGRSRLLMKGQ